MVETRPTLRGLAVGFLKFVVFVLMPMEALRIIGFALISRTLYVPVLAMFLMLEVLRQNVRGTVGQPILSATEYTVVLLLLLSRGTVVSADVDLMGNVYHVELGIAPILLVLIAFVFVPAMLMAFVDWFMSEEI